MSIQTVAVFGADGTLGPSILEALVSHGFTITLIKRASSKSLDTGYPSAVHSIQRIPDAFPTDALTSVLKGQDAVIVVFKPHDPATEIRLAQAAAQAGVKRFIAADFGSCDSSSPRIQSVLPLYRRKTAVRAALEELSAEQKHSGGFGWTSLVCGHFADWSPEFLHLDVRGRKADVLDDGETYFSLSSLGRIGEATVRVLRNLEPTRNKMLFVQSLRTTQNGLIKALERASGGEKWEVRKVESKSYEIEEKRKADEGDLEAVENLVWLLGMLESDWTKKENFAMELLGLEDESLDDLAEKLVREHGS